MKLSILSIFGILLICHSLEAKPSWSSFLNEVGSFGDKFKNIGHQIRKGYSVFKSNIASFEQDAYDTLKSSYDKVQDGAVSFYNNARDELSESTQKVENFIAKIPDLTTQEIFKQVKYGLDKASEELEKLIEKTDKNFEKAKETLNQQVFDVKSQVQTFTKRMNDIVVKKKQVTEGHEIIHEFVKDSAEEVLSCSQQALEPLQATYDDVKERIKEVLQKARELADSLEECVENAGIKKETYDCAKNVKDNVLNSFQEVVSTVTGVTVTLSTNGVKELFAGGCMAKTRVSVELKKSSVEKQINKLE